MTVEAFAWPSLLLLGPIAGCAVSIGLAFVWISTRILLDGGGRGRPGEDTAKVMMFVGFVFLTISVFLIVYAVSKDLFTQRIGM